MAIAARLRSYKVERIASQQPANPTHAVPANPDRRACSIKQAVRAGHTVRFVHADDFFWLRSGWTTPDKTFRSFLAPDLLILDDLGLHR